ncbi:hypothetical protein D9V84_04655 [Bacteroidetes/Chlorobi group bacterium Naka2016]|jgi:hypothetical protein|nr:MAG: hypothetical protein D9V84_04655 [Bacteroidetes/Chlorobi group bacterium Naka2016]
MTADFKFPNEIDPLGSNINRTLDFQKMPNLRQKQVSFRIGEILRGKIIEVISPQQAVISLPNGTFTAEISGRFQSGDELFFRVQAVDPSLVLKIHSVFVTKDNKKLPTNELIRILDLPKTPLFESIVERTKERANVILRDELILQARYANNLLENNPKTNLSLILYFIDFALENNLEPSKEFFQHFKTLFEINDLFPKLWSIIISNIELFPDSVRRQIQTIRNSVQSNQLINIFKLLSPNFFYNEDNLFELLLTKLDFSTLSGDIKSILESLKKWFTSFWVVNTSATLSFGTTLYFILPYIWENNIRFTTLRYKRKRFGTVEEQKIAFEDEELIEPIRGNIEEEFQHFFSNEDGKKELNLMQQHFKRQSRKEGTRLIVKTPFGAVQILRILNLNPENPSNVSIVI